MADLTGRWAASVAALFVVFGCGPKPGVIIEPVRPDPVGSGRTEPPAVVGAFQPWQAPPAPDAAPWGRSSLEQVADIDADTIMVATESQSYRVQRDRRYRLIGFACDPERGTVPDRLQLVLDGSEHDYRLACAGGLMREDVGKFFGNPALSPSGYQVAVSFERVEPGAYAVLVSWNSEDRARYSPTHHRIIVE